MEYSTYVEENFGILIADDQKFMLKFLSRYFKKYYNTFTADSITMAQEVLQQENIAVVVSDHQMANGEGVKLLEFIRDNYPGIRTVLITADKHEQTVIDMIANRLAYSFTYKPTVKENLHRLVEEQVRRYVSSAHSQ